MPKCESISIFDILPEDDEQRLLFAPKKSTDWRWSMKEDYPRESNGLTVFSCFACGGGSTMGYKLAGCKVLGCCEIDPAMNAVYVKNHHPKYNYLMDIRKFNEIPREELPEELLDLDILDASPPCTTFSMAGEREESWGKKKKFREGQAEQTLDDLSFVTIDTVAKLRPRVLIMENVEGILLGEAFEYVRKIYKQLKEIGYKCRHWLLKGETMGVPQKRHRVFFVAVREDISFDMDDIDLNFNYEVVTYGQIKEGEMKPLGEGTDYRRLTLAALPYEKCIADVNLRLHNKNSGFQSYFVDDDSIIPTQRAKPDIIDRNAVAYISKESIRNAQTFPSDYDFGNDTYSAVGYICGMSVPPIMIKRLVTRLIECGLFAYKENKQ